MEKVDALINLVGELVITQAMLKQVSHALDPVHAEQLFAGLDLLERNTRDLQEAVIGVRMLPVDAVFRRFPRLVRDLSSRLGKQVRLRTIGEGTELDKGLIEKIADPLVHLVRNSIDHGLEMPDVRRDAGKDETGTITLAASHQGGHIVIEVSDDGRGLNREKILSKAARARPERARQPHRRAGLGPDLPAGLLHRRCRHRSVRPWRGHGRGPPQHPGAGRRSAAGKQGRQRHPRADPAAADPGHPRRHDRGGGR